MYSLSIAGGFFSVLLCMLHVSKLFTQSVGQLGIPDRHTPVTSSSARLSARWDHPICLQEKTHGSIRSLVEVEQFYKGCHLTSWNFALTNRVSNSKDPDCKRRLASKAWKVHERLLLGPRGCLHLALAGHAAAGPTGAWIPGISNDRGLV